MRKVIVFAILMMGCLMASPVSAQETTGSDQSALVNVFEQVKALPRFGYIEEIDNENFGFSDAVGKGVMTGFGNADPREQVEQLLATIPSEYLLFEARNERNKIRSLYVDKSDASNPIMMFFLAVSGPNDTVLLLWRDGDLTQIEKEAAELESSLKEDGYKIK